MGSIVLSKDDAGMFEVADRLREFAGEGRESI
jgi:hypothetical protein